MENTSTICPVCTLYLREGINLETHLHTHPKEQVIEALLKFSNGGTVAVPVQQSSSTSTSSTTLSSTESVSSGNSQATVQTVANQNSPFLSGPYMAPQAQMTTAVTYQHFITSNGSTFMPQYIQVPAVVNPSNNIPVISNQTVNYIPNQPVNYSPTMYNPLYNPYIPQPYPFTQPVYTSMTMSTLPSGDPTVPSSVSTENSSGSDEMTNQVVATTQSNVLTKNTVVVNTSSEIRSTSTGSKKSLVKYRKKVKKRIFRTKLGEPSSSMSVIKSPVKNGSKPLGMKRSVISTIRPKISLQASNVTTNLTIIPPAPLKLITKPTTNTNLNAATPPPPPPLSKAPCIGPSSVTIIKSENLRECGRPQSTPAIILSSDNNNSVHNLNRPQKLNSVIVESNSLAGNSANETETFKHGEKSNQVEVSFVETSSSASVIMRKDKERSESLRIESSDDITITKVNTPAEHYKEGPEEEQAEDEDEVGGINDEIEDLEQDNGNLEKTAKFFEMIEVVEESKAHIIDSNLSSEAPKNSESDVSDNSFSGTDFRVHEESVTSKGNAQKEKESESKTFSEPEVEAAEAIDIVENIEKETSQIYNYRDNKETRVATQAGNRFEGEVVIEATIQKQTELQSITYTDLQPAGSPRVLNDISLTPTINLSSYMEVEGIKIFFNNSVAAGASVDPLGSTFKNLQSNTNDLPGFFKSEGSLNNHAVVDSVIQLVSGNGSESKSTFNFGENYSATTSHIQEPQLDLPDLSPLPLNIQADESMPARGELSEQESLGAENTTWNLFHGADASNTKNLEDWRNLVSGQQPVNGNKSTGKTFKCSICNKVFSCPKERRVHKNTAHFEKPQKVSAPRKPRTYSCNFCSTVFTTFRERKIHVLQMHSEGKKHSQNLKMSEIKQENGESELPEANKPRTTIKEEGEQENVKTETPTPAADSGSGTGVIPETEAHRIKYCSQCSLPFVGVKKLREHLRIVHGKIRFKCETCSQTFDDDSEYNEHLLVHPLVCDKCGKTFHKKPNLNLHMKRHLEVKPYECSLCPKSFVTRQKLEEHMNGHSGKKPLKCPHCDKTFSRHSNLIQHRNLHHMNVKKKIKDFVCRCGEVFHSLRKLEWHKEVHDPKPKPCPFCSQKFIHSASVTRHIRRAHLPDYLPGDNREFDNVQCPVCEKTYLRSSLVVHMRVHNGEKPFACKICNKKFSTKWNLEIHNWTHQSRSNMPFKCHICKGAFFREPDFVAHLNAHRNYKPFTCNVCGQKFIRKYSCLRHQEEHKKNKQFVCGVSGCAKSFHRGYYLRDHMKVHTGVRPHTCHICGKASSTKSNHNKHVRIHDTREPINTEN